ncbi:hypothetical protein GDO86_013692 [Hymenochirus boettgeri]|uniref:Uncharacterized protein n=1 Tax=Hymenochirus boettgeri TaxID=247094 RepID=A0A8T2IXT0_9PIPI|nr:hypothetical protein GDO86_013692 [Hymenochirus boettgeri]
MWSKSIIDLIPLKFGAQTIVGEKGKNGLTFKFCSTELVKADTVQTLPPCVIETK